jgi:hypothetical protein
MGAKITPFLFLHKFVSVLGLGALLNKWFVGQSFVNFVQGHLTSTK